MRRDKIETKIIEYGGDDYRASWELREEILRIPLGLTFTDEDKVAERNQIHLAGFVEGKLRAASVLVPKDNGTIKMQRVAVANKFRNCGLGSEMVALAEDYARNNGYKTLFCHARDTAIPFYLKHGFAEVGPSFIEQSIPHQKMVKEIRS